MTTIILTFNEEMHIARSIKCAQAFSSEVVVVDSFSTDRTIEIAEAAGARVLCNKFISHAKQFNWALDHGTIQTKWVLRLDADETIGSDLAARIRDNLASIPIEITGILFNRRHVFMGRWVRRGGRYPLYMLRLWRTGLGRVEDRWMDEHVVVREGRTIKWEGEFADISERDLTFFIHKHDRYAAREAIEILDKKYDLLEREPIRMGGSGVQARAKRLLKELIYNRLPFGLGPTSYFLYRVTVQLGFLDGKTGMIYHFLQGLWYRLLVEAKVAEFELAMRGVQSRAERLSILERVSGVRFST